jgi:hypothetical protein
MRLIMLSALVVIALVATTAVHPTPANAVIYCKTAGVPRGCVVRRAAPAAQTKLCPIVQLDSDGSISSVIACPLVEGTLTYDGPPVRSQRTAAAKRK